MNLIKVDLSKPWLKAFIVGILLLWAAGCTSDSKPPPEDASTSPEMTPDASMPKIDLHAHYRAQRDYLLPLFDSLNLQSLLVDVGRVDEEAWEKQRAGLIENYQQHQEYYYFCTSFTANGIEHDDYADKIIAHIQHDLDLGAVMVKVWKNFGMVSKDNAGNYVHIDDPRIQPVWDFLIAERIPVLAHIGEPLQAWLPIDEDNPHAGYYKNNPQYHAYQHPEIPSWETIQEARNNWLAKNPDLIVVGAHNGSMSHDVQLIAQTLDKYPNFYVEPAARFGDLVRQESSAVRSFIINYQDRFLYGTDLGTSADLEKMTEADISREKQRIVDMLDRHWRYLSGSGMIDFTRSPTDSRQVEALNLPDSVLRKVYYHNAIKILKGNS